MDLFFRLFNPGISLRIFAIVMLATFVTTIVLYYKASRRSTAILAVWIVACLFLMLYATVLGRTPHEGFSVNLVPLWSIGAIRDGYVETIYEKIYNVIFFAPYGMLLGLYFGLDSTWPKAVWRSLKAGVVTSVAIELLQLITRTGTCETDDVICNALGCAAGCMLGALAAYAWKRLRQVNDYSDYGTKTRTNTRLDQ